MERITQFLEKHEKILWQYSYKDNLMEQISFGFIISIIHILTPIIPSLVLCLITRSFSPLIIIIFTAPFIGLGVFFGISSIKKLKNRCKTTRLSKSQLKHYENFFILTNKRWIQKAYRINLKVDESLYDKGRLEKQFDMVFANLNLLDALSIETFDVAGNKRGANIKFYLHPFDKDSKDSKVGFDTTLQEKYLDFMKNINGIIDLEKTSQTRDGPFEETTIYIPKK